MSKYETYGKISPIFDLKELTGKLICIEGGDGAGRTTQSKLLQDAVERLGYPTVSLQLLKSSTLSVDLMSQLKSNRVCARTLALFYATSFMDQLENEIIPALRAGSIVITNGYIHRLIAKSIVLGLEFDWLSSIYSLALKPQSTIYLDLEPQVLAGRTFSKRVISNNWSYGAIFERTNSVYKAFIDHQKKFKDAINSISGTFSFEAVNGQGAKEEVHTNIMNSLKTVLK